jgi:phosphonate transport system substrate-binding protein
MRVLLLGFAVAAGCATSAGIKSASGPDLPAAAPGTLTAALVTSVSNKDVQAQSQAFADFIKAATGKPTRPAVFPDYDSLSVAISKGLIDIAFMPPLAYVRAKGQANVQPLLRALRSGQATYRALLVSPEGSPIKTMEDLKKAQNLRAAWVDSSSATGYIFPKALLFQHQIDPAGVFVSQDFLGNHDAVCRALGSGKADLGATFSDDPADGPAKVATGCAAALGEKVKSLQIVAATENIPNDVLVARADLPDDVKGPLLTAAQGLSATDEGKKVLSAAFLAEGLAAVSDDDYAPVRAALDVFKQ